MSFQIFTWISVGIVENWALRAIVLEQSLVTGLVGKMNPKEPVEFAFRFSKHNIATVGLKAPGALLGHVPRSPISL